MSKTPPCRLYGDDDYDEINQQAAEDEAEAYMVEHMGKPPTAPEDAEEFGRIFDATPLYIGRDEHGEETFIPPVVGVVTGGRFVDPDSGARYTWPDGVVPLDPEPLGAGWQNLGYLTEDTWEHNSFAVRRDPAYDDSYLRSDTVVAWGDPAPMTTQTVSLYIEQISADILALIYGGTHDRADLAGVPLCLQVIPAQGTE